MGRLPLRRGGDPCRAAGPGWSPPPQRTTGRPPRSRPAAARDRHHPPARARPGTRRAARRSSDGPRRRTRARPGPTASYGRRCPVGEVVPALVPGPRPVGDLVAAEPGRAEAVHRQPVLRGRTVVVLVLDGRRPPSSGSRLRRQVVTRRARQAFGVRIVQREGIRGDVIGLQRQGGVERGGPHGLGLRRARRTGGRARRIRTRRPAPTRRRTRRPRARAAGRAAGAAPGRTTAPPSRVG